jgi:hypothetical protein
MNRALKVALLAVLIGCFLIPSIPAPYIAADDCNNEAVVMIHAPWMAAWWYDLYGHNNPVLSITISACKGCLFTPQVRITQPTVSIYLKKYPYAPGPSANVLMEVWKVAWNAGEGAYCHVGDDPIITKSFSTTGWATNEWYWVSAYSPTAVLLQDEDYSIEIRPQDGKYVVWGTDDEPRAFPFAVYFCYAGGCDGLKTAYGHYAGAMVQGCWAPPINVLTQDGYVTQDGNIVMGGLVTQLGTTGTVKAYIDYGFTEELGNEQFIKNVNTVTPPGSYYNWQLTTWPSESYLYFRARIVDTVSGEVDYGEIKEVFMPATIPQISCEVVVNDAWDCTFETVINSIDEVESVDLVLYYGFNWSCYGIPSSVAMFMDVDEPGVFRWNDVNWGIFEPGRTYYYYAEEQEHGTNATIVRSETKQFKRYDPNKPKWRNWVENWLAGLWGTAELPEINGWWMLAIVVFLIVFFLTTRAKNWRLGLAWGMIAMMVLLYVLVSQGLVDPWLVVLLSIVAAYVIYKFAFRPVMHK